MEKKAVMEKRRCIREPVSLKVKLVSDGKDYPAFIKNLSKYGVQITAASKEKISSFIPENTVNLIYKPFLDKTIYLNCEVRWVQVDETSSPALTYSMGMEIKHQIPL